MAWIKKSKLSFVLILIALFLSGSYIKVKQPKEVFISCVGDSITAHGHYVQTLQSLIDNSVISNFGINGATSYDIVKTTNQWINSPNIILLIGINNVDNPRRVVLDITKIRNSMTKGNKLFVVSILPFELSKYWTKELQTNKKIINDTLKKIFKRDRHTYYIDAGPALRGYSNRGADRILPIYSEEDGLHLNMIGQYKLAQIIYGQIRDKLKK